MVFSASISGVLIALLIMMQTLTAVSALPTTTTTTSTIATATISISPQLETRQALDSNQDNKNNDHGNDIDIVPPNNPTTSRREFAIRAMLPQFYKRDNSDNHEHNSNGLSLGGVLGIIIAALTLLVAMIPLFRCPRFQYWVSSLIPPFVQKALGITLPNPMSTALTTPEDASLVPAPEIPIPPPVLIYNHYSNTHLLGTYSNIFPNSQNGIAGEHGRTPQAEESLAPRRPERAATCPFP